MRQILSFLFIVLIAGCNGGQNPVAGPDDTPRVAAKMTITAEKWGGGSGGPALRRNEPRELVSTSSHPVGLTVTSESVGGFHSVTTMRDTSFYRDGSLRSITQYYHDEKNRPIRHGLYINYWETGELKERCHYYAREKHGVCVSYYQNGQIEKLHRYSNGARVGREVSYFENGQMSRRAFWNSSGVHGASLNWYENGQLAREWHYVHGEREGKSVNYYPSGQIKGLTTYSNDLRVSQVLYFENGEMELSRSYDSNGKKHGAELEWHDNGQLAIEGHHVHGEREGKWVEYYPSGQIEEVTTYSNGVWFSEVRYFENGEMELSRSYDSNGKKHGAELEWYENGQLVTETHYVHGVREGKSVDYYLSGQIEEITTYSNDVRVSQVFYSDNGEVEHSRSYDLNGEYHGAWLEWHENGQLAIERHYVHGEREGKWVEYYPSGQIEELTTYSNDLRVSRVFYFENGEMELSRSYDSNGKKHGAELEWYENGQLAIEGHHVHGEREGKWVEYYPSGQIAMLSQFSNDSKVGQWIQYWENGEMSLSETWDSNGRRHGPTLVWGENGQLFFEGHHVHGEKEGKWVRYDEEGNIIDEDIYKDGECVELCEDWD